MDYYELAEQLFNMRAQMPRLKMERTVAQNGRGEAMVLHYLAANDGKAYPKDISRAFMLTSARIAAVLKALEKRGLITRTPDPEDNRQIIVELTEKGAASMAEHHKEVIETMARMLEALGEHDAKEYVRIQNKLISLDRVWR